MKIHDKISSMFLCIVSSFCAVFYSCSNEALEISSGISKDNLHGNWKCTYSLIREWSNDSISFDSVISNDTGLFLIKFTNNSLIIDSGSGQDNLKSDTTSYLFINDNLLYIKSLPPYFFGYVEIYYNDSTLLTREYGLWERHSDSDMEEFFKENVYHFKKDTK